MQLEYYLGPDDVTAYATYHASLSPTVKRRVNLIRYVFPALLIVFAVLWNLIAFPRLFSIALIFIAIVWFFIWPHRWKRAYVRQLQRMYAEGSNRAVFGKHTLEVRDDVLIATTDLLETRYKWPAIERITATDDYTFVYVSAVQAIVIPRAAITSGDYDAAVEAIRRHHQNENPDT